MSSNKKIRKAAKKNLYLVLDLLPGASHNELLHAYNRAKRTYSNDSLASYSILEEGSSDAILDEIEEAFEVLGNPAKRRKYDMEMDFKTWSDSDDQRAQEETVSPDTIFFGEKNSSREPEKKKPHLKKVPPPEDFKPDEKIESQIERMEDVTGTSIRELREYKKLSVEELANRCKLSVSNIEAIETEDEQLLVHPTYVRGHVMLICQVLELPNPSELSKSFIQRLKNEGKFKQSPF